MATIFAIIAYATIAESAKETEISTNRNGSPRGFRSSLRKRQRGPREERRTPRAGRAAAHEPAPAPELDSLQLFMKEAGRYPLLTKEEEVELAKAIERGDMDAKDRMINSNLRLVVSVARGYENQGLPLPDLIQEGMLGLIRAAEKFDWRKGYKFSTYATLWIRQAIGRGLSNTGRVIRLPVHIGQRERKVARAERELSVKLGRDPTLPELAEATALEVEEIEAVRDAARAVTSLDQPVGEDGETTMGELIGSERPSPDEEVATAEVERGVREALAGLESRERRVVEMRFGLGRTRPASLHEVGRELGVSAEEARRVEERALERLADSEELAALRAAA